MLTRLKPALLLLLLIAPPLHATDDNQYVVYTSESSYEDVIQGLKLAIEERGMYINNVMHMSEMLDRTGKDLAIEKKIYERAESIEFCSALLSHRMTAEDPRRIINCPFIVAVYVLPEHPDKTYVVHRHLGSDATSPAMQDVMNMLKEVATAGAAGF